MQVNRIEITLHYLETFKLKQEDKNACLESLDVAFKVRYNWEHKFPNIAHALST